MATREDINALCQQYLDRDARPEVLVLAWHNEQGATLDDVEYNIAMSEEAQQFRLDQTDMLEDTTAEDTTAEDVVAEADDQDSYTVTSRAKGGASSRLVALKILIQRQLVQMTNNSYGKSLKIQTSYKIIWFIENHGL